MAIQIEQKCGLWEPQAIQWSNELADSFLSYDLSGFDPNQYMHGEGIPNVTPWQRIRADYVMLRSRLMIPRFKSQVITLEEAQNQTRFVKYAEDVYSPLQPNFKGPFFEDPQFAKEYLHEIYQYGSEPLSLLSLNRRYTRIKAAANSIGLILMSDIDSIEDPRIKAICALSYIHPVADTMVDSFAETLDKDKLGRLLGRLRGDEVEPEQADEKVLFQMLGDIESVYPRDYFPQLYFVMDRLHEVQLRSLMQRGKLTPHELIYSSFQKGGWATVLYGAIASGGLNDEQFEWLMKKGSAQQLIDDFMDTKEDIEEGNSTIFTAALAESGVMDDAIARYHLLEQDLLALGDYPTDKQILKTNMTIAFSDVRVAKIMALYLNYGNLSGKFRKAFKKVRPLHNLLFNRTIKNFIYS